MKTIDLFRNLYFDLQMDDAEFIEELRRIHLRKSFHDLIAMSSKLDIKTL